VCRKHNRLLDNNEETMLMTLLNADDKIKKNIKLEPSSLFLSSQTIMGIKRTENRKIENPSRSF